MTEAEMCLRLLAAAGFGVVIGIERQYSNKPAGLRTHVIVCVASALLTTSSILMGEQLGAPGETLRVAAGVVTGVGFIGAGTILQTQRAVTGLTTAATVFTAAGIGIAVGGGLYYLSLTAAALTVFSTWILKRFDAARGENGGNADEEPRRRRFGRHVPARRDPS